MNGPQDHVGFIWSVAELLRGDFKQSEYGRVVLPLTVLRRLDCVLEPTKAQVLARAAKLPAKADEKMRDHMLQKEAGQGFYNLSKFTFATLLGDPQHVAANLNNYIAGFSPNAREIFLDKFKFGDQIARLDEANLLYLVLKRFAEIDLHPEVVDNHRMGHVFEELIRRFSEQSNETAGEHFTPREVIWLMVNLLFAEDGDALTTKGAIRTLYDPACGTGGMLSVAEEYLFKHNPSAKLVLYGQEINPESYAICKSDMLIKGADAGNIKFGNSFTQDGLPDDRFNYMLSNPPFGVDWKKYEDAIRDEHEKRGTAGRFGVGLPRVSDGSLLFLQHMISKFKQNGTGSRLAIVFNGSPLFTGGAGSGESEIRRWIVENDWLEAVVALPDQLFYNTGIGTYIWVVTNRKAPRRRGKVQLIDASGFFAKMRKSLGNKRNEISPDQIAEITRLYGDFAEGPHVKVFPNEEFGYRRVTVERPLRLNFACTPERLARVKESAPFLALAKKDGGSEQQTGIVDALESLADEPPVKDRDDFAERLRALFRDRRCEVKPPLFKAILAALGEQDETAQVCTDAKGNPEPDADLRDTENVPLAEDVDEYIKREVLPHVPDAWIDADKTRVGYEIPFTRYFYQYTPLRPLAEIEAEIIGLEGEIQKKLTRVIE